MTKFDYFLTGLLILIFGGFLGLEWHMLRLMDPWVFPTVNICLFVARLEYNVRYNINHINLMACKLKLDFYYTGKQVSRLRWGVRPCAYKLTKLGWEFWPAGWIPKSPYLWIEIRIKNISFFQYTLEARLGEDLVGLCTPPEPWW